MSKEFLEAVCAGEIEKVKVLVAAEPGLVNTKNEQSQSAVLLAVYNGRKEIRDFLIASGATLALHEAAATGQLAGVKELVEQDPASAKSYSPDGFPILALAAVFGHFEVAKYLHSKGGDVNAAATNGTGYNALTGAVTSGHKEMVAWLLESGANVNYRYGPGFTPLLAAAANGHLEIVKLLLAHGADLQAKSNDGKSSLAYAEERKHAAVAEMLRSKGLAQ